ncbi:MAG: type II restriction endonuclease [candidate division Zixibacteria bacterium]|nr:type II restriction endonuclease [Candidatus Tariuqbacter arcticus]
MKLLEFYTDSMRLYNEEQVFSFLINNLKPSNILWSYFVNWNKVFENIRKIEVSLNIFNYLIGKENFEEEFKFLIKENPQIAKVIPALLVRSGSGSMKFKILVDYRNKKLVYDNYDFDKENITEEYIDKYIVFMRETGLRDLIVSRKIKNLVDYLIGVEAGLDSHGRKNRGGDAMETIVEIFVNDLCNKNGFRYLKEANAERIEAELCYIVPVDKSSRRYDFVIDSGNELFIIETNFYQGGGSKLKSTAGEYRNLFDVLHDKYKFVWITDGFGWKTTTKPLRETFDHNDYIFNLSMLEKGILEYLLCS